MFRFCLNFIRCSYLACFLSFRIDCTMKSTMPVFNHEIRWFPAMLESYLSKRKSEFGNKIHLALLIEWKQEKLTRNPKQEALEFFFFFSCNRSRKYTFDSRVWSNYVQLLLSSWLSFCCFISTALCSLAVVSKRSLGGFLRHFPYPCSPVLCCWIAHSLSKGRPCPASVPTSPWNPIFPSTTTSLFLYGCYATTS